MRILRILIVVWIYLLISAMSYGAIELGEVVDKLYADLDGDLRQEVIILRRAKLPLKGERVEIWRSEQEQDPAFASDWKEVVEPKVLRMSAKGELSLETVGNRVLVKYIWREFGEGTGAGHEHEQLIYYGYVDKEFRKVFEYNLKDVRWNKHDDKIPGSRKETKASVTFEDLDGDGEPEICISTIEKVQKSTRDNQEVPQVEEVKTERKLHYYKWKKSRGFILMQEKR